MGPPLFAKGAQYSKTGGNQACGPERRDYSSGTRTSLGLLRYPGMLTTSECLLRAENYEVAAKLSEGVTRMALLEKAAKWRSAAYRMQMQRFEHLRTGDQGKKH